MILMGPAIKNVDLHIYTKRGLQVKKNYDMSVWENNDRAKVLKFKSKF